MDKLRNQTNQIRDMKADAEKNIQLIQYLENQNQTLEAKVSSKETIFTDSSQQSLLEQKDDKIGDLIKEIGLQDGLREQLESVQKILSSVQNQAYGEEKQFQSKLKHLEEKYEKDKDWF